MTEIIENPDNLPAIVDFAFDIYGNDFSFRKNPKLKRKNIVLPYTKNHIEEMVKCRNDIYYFAENYYKIVDLDEGLVTIQLRDYQRRLIDNFVNNKFSISIAPRQCGKTTAFACFILWYILFNKDKEVAILSNKDDQSKEILERVKLAYENLPFWLQQGMLTWNKKSIKIENGCKVISAGTSSSTIRGKSINLLIIDEVAHVATAVWNDFYSSVYPTTSSAKTSKVIFVSTPNGMNHFYKIFSMAERKKNNFSAVRVKWQEVPHYTEEWKRMTIADIGKRTFDQEYECLFLASANSLIDASVLENIVPGTIVNLEQIPIYDDIMSISEKFHDMINIYEEPIEGEQYVMGVDSAKITEVSAGDSLSVQISNVSRFPYKQVGTVIIPSEIHYLEIPEFLNTLGYYYNEAWAFIENNDTVGQEIADTLLYDYEYENVYFEKAGISGFRTTKKNKKIGCLNIKMLIEKEQLLITDPDTIAQISTFIKQTNSYAAEKGYQDDAIMALIHSFVFMQDRMFFDDKMKLMAQMNPNLPSNKMKSKEQKEREDFEEAPMPFGFGTDGTEMDADNIIFN